MKAFLSTKELAEAIGASESSLRRWTDSGAVRTTRTVGGHRRIPLADAIRFIRESHSVVVRPEILGLDAGVVPALTDSGEPTLDERFYESLTHGDALHSRSILTTEYLGGATLASLCDGPIRFAMRKFGELWRHESEAGILAEHRATDICIGVVSHLRHLLQSVPATTPLALGAAPDGDPYLLPSMMAAAVLAEVGLRDMNFGPRTPVPLLETAAEKHGADLVWISISFIADKSKLQREIEHLAGQLNLHGARLVIGGRHSAELDIKRLANVQLADSMAGLAAIGSAVASAHHPAAPKKKHPSKKS